MAPPTSSKNPKPGNPGHFHGRRLELLLEFLPLYLAKRHSKKECAELWAEIKTRWYTEFPYHLRDGLGAPLVLAPEILYKLDEEARREAQSKECFQVHEAHSPT